MPDHSDGQPQRRLVGLREPVKARLGGASLAGTAASLVWLVQAWLIADVLAGLTSGPASHVRVAGAAAAFFALAVVRSMIVYVADGIAFAAGEAAVMRARAELLARASRANPLADRTMASAELASLAAERLELISPYFVRYLPALVRVAILPAAIIAVAAVFSWAVALILVMTGPLIPVFMALVGLAARQASEKQMREIGSLNALVAERVRAMPDTLLLDATQQMIAGFAAAAEALRARTMAVLRIAFLSSAVLELFSAIGIAMVAVYVGFSLLGELHFGTYGEPLGLRGGIFVLLLAPDFFQPLRDVAAAWHDRAAALAAADELERAEAMLADDVVGSGETRAMLPGPATLRTRGLSWSPGEGRSIRFPDLDVEAGSSLAITGVSGAGKSTLVAILTGLLRPSAGTVEVAGKRLADETADAWRARIGWVAQAPHFLNASLRANVLLGEPDEDDRFRAAISAAALDKAIAAMPQGELTRLGELGHGVSGGEARRILIARAHYKRADVIIADEPTADLDEETAGLVTEALIAAKGRGATLVVVTHDPVLAARMDARIDLVARS